MRVWPNGTRSMARLSKSIGELQGTAGAGRGQRFSKKTRHWRRVAVLGETVGKVSRFAAALCVVIHTRKGKLLGLQPLVSPEFAGCLGPADRRQRTGEFGWPSVKPF